MRGASHSTCSGARPPKSLARSTRTAAGDWKSRLPAAKPGQDRQTQTDPKAGSSPKPPQADLDGGFWLGILSHRPMHHVSEICGTHV